MSGKKREKKAKGMIKEGICAGIPAKKVVLTEDELNPQPRYGNKEEPFSKEWLKKFATKVEKKKV